MGGRLAAVLLTVAPLAACATGAAAPVTTATSSPAPDGVGRTATPAVVRHVGALLHAGGDHFCSGTVVGPSLVVTAAHCVAAAPGGPAYDDLEFAPGYRDGAEPYGLWRSTRVTVDPRWTDSADPDLDVAFVALAPRDGRRIADVLGADRIGFDPPAVGTVRLTGYPKGADDPTTCVGTSARESAGQLRIACTGYGDGTSGSPWLTGWDPATGTGTVIGVIGGYRLGGDTDDVSYSPYFGEDVRRLYEQSSLSSP
ncbi:MAG TPA: trypsin-like peptidase domain-containing protein [Mycobacteriales bacterium]